MGQAFAQEGVAEIVVAFGDLLRTSQGLEVAQPHQHEKKPVAPVEDAMVQVLAERAADHLVETIAVPPAFDVTLAQA